MHPHEPDGINDALAGALRVALTIAGQLAERAARAREQQARQAQAASDQQARELQARLAAERSGARAALAPVHRDDWWQHAEPDDIARAWQTAQTWRDLDPDAERAGERIRDQLRARYQLDTRQLEADPAAVRDALDAHDAGARGGDSDRARSRGGLAEAASLLASADRTDAAQQSLSGRQLGEAASREQLAAALEGVADADTVRARVVAATNQARPAAEAVSAPPRRAPRPRRFRGTSPVRDRGRSR